LEKELRTLEKRLEENLKEATEGYKSFEQKINLEKPKSAKRNFLNGNQGIKEGAIKSGLDVFCLSMTPATPVMDELAKVQEKNNFLVLELENEIAVANAGVGACITGAKGMVGTSGGGFDLMTETLSLTGIAQVPLIFYLCSRPGPATGVATYTSQGDLKLAINAGHGEFNRIVLVPGDPVEAEELTNQAFYFSHKFGIPSIIVGDKHLAESLILLRKSRSWLKFQVKQN
jgi:2-oxoglutarate ferredoxin oxidoreductase subunit alpha